jgi:pyrroline-5-carboxylate reductase
LTTDLPSSLILVGAGKMGGAMLEGWLAVGLPPAALAIVEPNPSARIADLCRDRGIRLNPPPDNLAPPEALVLAIKPQALAAAAKGVNPLVGLNTLLLSILAGKTIGDLRRAIPNARAVVRAMPNLPASVRKGATGAAASAEATGQQKATAHALLAAVGHVEWLASEDLIDAVTAVSGSGPAYVFHLVECLAEAGAAAGLPPDLAMRLARAMVVGSGELLAQSDLPAARLRENVTSPGGTTAAALAVLMREPGLAALMREAVAAAKRRAGELSG